MLSEKTKQIAKQIDDDLYRIQDRLRVAQSINSEGGNKDAVDMILEESINQIKKLRLSANFKKKHKFTNLNKIT